jgi:hypothetical protein
MDKVKADIDEAINQNQWMMENRAFFMDLSWQIIIKKFEEENIKTDYNLLTSFRNYITDEYIEEYNF